MPSPTRPRTTIIDDARVLVPRQSNVTSYYPCVSEDSKWVVFSQSNCGGNPSATDINYNGTAGYGTGVCDGYDDSSAKLLPGRHRRRRNALTRHASGGSAHYDDSWPRFGPTVTTFRGQTLYWVAFSSRRPYGVQNNTGGLGHLAAATLVRRAHPGRSASATRASRRFGCPAQNPTGNGNAYGNHTPQWVTVATPIAAP